MNDRQVRDAAARWLAEERAAVVVEVTQALGSAPREAGTRMLVASDVVAGTVGGGHLELKAIAHARQMLLDLTIEVPASLLPPRQDKSPHPER